MNRWFYFNFIVLVFALWKIFTGSLGVHVIFGAIGIMLILYNWTRHAMFSTIRETSDRQKKIRYAKISKRALPYHKWVGTAALIFIIIHGSLVIHKFGIHLSSQKIVTGLITATALLALVIMGWLRWLKTTPAKRYIHLALGYIVFFLLITHLFF